MIKEVGLGSSGTTPTDTNGFNSWSRLNTWSRWNWIFDDWSRIAGDRAGITWSWGLQQAASSAQRDVEDADEPFRDLSPLIVAMLATYDQLKHHLAE